MEMVAASKMRKAQERTLAGKPYTQKLTSVVRNLVGRIEEGSHPYLMEKEKGKTLLLIFSSDKGLCGSFNTNLLREFLKTDYKDEVEVVSIGKKLQRPVVRMGASLIADFPFGTTLPSFEHVLPVSMLVVDSFLHKAYKKVLCIFTQFVSLSLQKPIVMTLLPIAKALQEREMPVLPYTFEPNAGELLTALMPHFLEMNLYQVFLESYASEQAARMLAMHEASENAKDVIFELSLTYNKARQERITNELLDISTGAMGVGL